MYLFLNLVTFWTIASRFRSVVANDDDPSVTLRSSPPPILSSNHNVELSTVATEVAPPLGFSRVGEDLYGSSPIDSSMNTRFGISVALSFTGNRLFVGAPGHNYRTSHPSSFVSLNGGAIFLYEYDGIHWNLIHFFPGFSAEEYFGQYFSINHDGTRLAVRRSRGRGTSFVQVYSIRSSLDGSSFQEEEEKEKEEEEQWMPQQLGKDLYCTDGTSGNTVTLSSDGNRVAVSCEHFHRNTGQVRIYDFVDGNWVPSGGENNYILVGDALGDFFGWNTAFSKSSNRIVISAPNHDGSEDGNFPRRGMVRVFVFDGTHWKQNGEDILGTSPNDQFGFSIDLNSDGSIIAVSSPSSSSSGNNNSNGGGSSDEDETFYVGNVQVFSESPTDSGFGTKWSKIGNTIEGVNRNDRFGRSLSISNDGSRLAASSYIHDGFRGHVRVFDFDLHSNTWNQHGEDIDGDNLQDRFAFGRFSVSLTGDGSRLASGSVYYKDVTNGSSIGRARVFHVLPIIASEQESSSSSDVQPSETAILSQPPSNAPSAVASLPMSDDITAIPSQPQSDVHSTYPSQRPPRNPSVYPSQLPSDIPSAVPIQQKSDAPSALHSEAMTPSPTQIPWATAHILPSTASPHAETTDQLKTLDAKLSSTLPPSSANISLVNDVKNVDWGLERVGSIEVTFDEDSLREEITLYYNIHQNLTSRVAVFKEDCGTLLPSTVVGIRTTMIPSISNDEGYVTLEVDLDLKREQVFGSPIFTPLDIETGLVSVCVRVDLFTSDSDNAKPVVFHQQKLFITVAATSTTTDENFAFLAIDVDHTNGQEKSESADRIVDDIHYNLTSCQCNNETFMCVSDALEQDESKLFFICVRTTTANVRLSSLRELSLSKADNEPTRDYVVDGVLEDEFTQVSILNVDGENDSLALIKTHLHSDLFDESFDPGDVIVQGICELSFVDNTTRDNNNRLTRQRQRRLGVPIEGGNGEGDVRIRRKNMEEIQVDFDIRLTLQPLHHQRSSSAPSSVESSASTTVVKGLVSVVFFTTIGFVFMLI